MGLGLNNYPDFGWSQVRDEDFSMLSLAYQMDRNTYENSNIQ